MIDSPVFKTVASTDAMLEKKMPMTVHTQVVTSRARRYTWCLGRSGERSAFSDMVLGEKKSIITVDYNNTNS